MLWTVAVSDAGRSQITRQPSLVSPEAQLAMAMIERALDDLAGRKLLSTDFKRSHAYKVQREARRWINGRAGKAHVRVCVHSSRPRGGGGQGKGSWASMSESIVLPSSQWRRRKKTSPGATSSKLLPGRRASNPDSVLRSVDRARRLFSPKSDAITAASLLEREELLLEQFRLIGEASYRRRQEIELELFDVRRRLELLGWRAKARNLPSIALPGRATTSRSSRGS